MAATAASKETPDLRHQHFGHVGYDNLAKLQDKDMVDGKSVPVEEFKQQQQLKPFCEACTLSKQHQLPFPDSKSRSLDKFELIHIDVCAPNASRHTSHYACRHA